MKTLDESIFDEEEFFSEEEKEHVNLYIEKCHEFLRDRLDEFIDETQRLGI